MSSTNQLAGWVRDARERTLEIYADLHDGQLLGPKLSIVNPPLWEIGHVAWFQERWVLRHALGRPPLRADADALYDSIAVPPEVRWDLPLPNLDGTLAYVRAVRDEVLALLDRPDPGPALRYFVLLSVFHEDMHTEAFTYSRQTLGYPAPPLIVPSFPRAASVAPPARGDTLIPGGTFQRGATPDEPFVFDNEKWAHPVELAPFLIARTPVTQEEFAAFVDDEGYRRRAWWSEAGWEWREQAEAVHPVYWRRVAGAWQRRDFDQWLPLEPERPMIHVNWFEAEAYCRWAQRRLPTEAEWEAAAASEPGAGGKLSPHKRRFPWGDDLPTPERGRLDWSGLGCAPVDAYASGDSAFGCRQMIGNVWEWTADDFLPYPGFVVDPYREYSEPWFGSRKVLRGGCWASRGRMLRNTWRNFFTPARRDIFAGFRTCALSP